MTLAARSNAAAPLRPQSRDTLAKSNKGDLVNILRSALAALAFLLLAACYPPTTSHPVGSTSGLKLDPALTGLWKAPPNDPDERGTYLHFLPKLDGTLTIIMVQSGDKPDADWSQIAATTGKAGANRYMNAQLLGSDGKPDKGSPGGTVPVLYRFDAKGRLMLYLMNEDRTKAAIKAGKIKGTVGKGEYGDAVITLDAPSLDRFMASPAALALFAKPFLTLHRME